MEESVRFAVLRRFEQKGGSTELGNAVAPIKIELEEKRRAQEDAAQRARAEALAAREAEERRAAELAREQAEEVEREEAVARNDRERARIEALQKEAEDRNMSRLAALLLVGFLVFVSVSVWTRMNSGGP